MDYTGYCWRFGYSNTTVTVQFFRTRRVRKLIKHCIQPFLSVTGNCLSLSLSLWHTLEDEVHVLFQCPACIEFVRNNYGLTQPVNQPNWSRVGNILACEDELKTINLSKFLTARVNHEISAYIILFSSLFLEYAYIDTSGLSTPCIFDVHDVYLYFVPFYHFAQCLL